MMSGMTELMFKIFSRNINIKKNVNSNSNNKNEHDSTSNIIEIKNNINKTKTQTETLPVKLTAQDLTNGKSNKQILFFFVMILYV